MLLSRAPQPPTGKKRSGSKTRPPSGLNDLSYISLSFDDDTAETLLASEFDRDWTPARAIASGFLSRRGLFNEHDRLVYCDSEPEGRYETGIQCSSGARVGAGISRSCLWIISIKHQIEHGYRGPTRLLELRQRGRDPSDRAPCRQRSPLCNPLTHIGGIKRSPFKISWTALARIRPATIRSNFAEIEPGGDE